MFEGAGRDDLLRRGKIKGKRRLGGMMSKMTSLKTEYET